MCHVHFKESSEDGNIPDDKTDMGQSSKVSIHEGLEKYKHIEKKLREAVKNLDTETFLHFAKVISVKLVI